MSFFEENLAALRARGETTLAREMERFSARVEGLSVLPSRRGLPGLVGRGPQGEEIPIEDREDPTRLGKEWEKKIGPGTRLVMLLGAGLGHPLKPLLVRREIEFLWWIEPEPVLFRIALECLDLRRVLSDPRIRFFVGVGSDVVSETLRKTFDHAPTPGAFLPLLPDYVLLSHPALLYLRPTLEETYRKALEPVFHSSGRNHRTIGTFADLWRRNILANLHHLPDAPPVSDLFGRARGVPAVLIGAGPSLDKNCAALRGCEDRALIAVVDTALRTVRAQGVRPHLVVSLDATPANVADFLGVDPGDAALAFIPTVAPEIPDLFEKKFVGSYGHPLQNHVEEALGPFGDLLVSGSVSTAGFDLLRRMGASPIVLVGMDLALGAATHTRGNLENHLPSLSRFFSFESLSTQNMTHRPGTEAESEIEGWGGGRVRTRIRMLRWREWFEEEIARKGLRVVNATEGGARIAGTDERPLAETLASFLNVRPGGPARALDVEVSAARREKRARALSETLDRILAEGPDGPLAKKILDWEAVVYDATKYAASREAFREEVTRAARRLGGR